MVFCPVMKRDCFSWLPPGASRFLQCKLVSWPHARVAERSGGTRLTLRGLARHQRLVRAHERVPKETPGENVFDKFDDLILKQLGCLAIASP